MQVATLFERRFGVSPQPLQTLPVADWAEHARSFVQYDPMVAAFEQVGGECHYRMDFSKTSGEAQAEICAISRNFSIQILDYTFREPMITPYVWPDVMRIRIARDGLEGWASHGSRPVLVEGPSTLITIEAAGQAPAEAVFAGSHKSVYVYITRETLRTLYQGRETELPTLLQAFLDGALKRTVVRRAPIRSELLRCLDDVQNSELNGLMRTLFLRAKAVEILCHALKMLEQDESFTAPDASATTARGVLRAQHILTERFAAPPSLEDLAREVGVGRSNLCAGFRQIHGRSIFEYLQEIRMARAFELLTETQTPITEVAFTVGFSHPSSFTVAVERRFGKSPSELRRASRLA